MASFLHTHGLLLAPSQALDELTYDEVPELERQISNWVRDTDVAIDMTPDVLPPVDAERPSRREVLNEGLRAITGPFGVFEGIATLLNDAAIDAGASRLLPTDLIRAAQTTIAQVQRAFDAADKSYLAESAASRPNVLFILGHNYMKGRTAGTDALEDIRRILSSIPVSLCSGLGFIEFAPCIVQNTPPPVTDSPNSTDTGSDGTASNWVTSGRFHNSENAVEVSTHQQYYQARLDDMRNHPEGLHAPLDEAEANLRAGFIHEVQRTISHEVVHYAVAHCLPISVLREWVRVARGEKANVTEYVAKHRVESPPSLADEEDLCESGALFLEEPEVLFTEAPERFDFWARQLPGVYSAAVVELLRHQRANGKLPGLGLLWLTFRSIRTPLSQETGTARHTRS